jgi:hypothetical protein
MIGSNILVIPSILDDSLMSLSVHFFVLSHRYNSASDLFYHRYVFPVSMEIIKYILLVFIFFHLILCLPILLNIKLVYSFTAMS